jgi:hypothetical protein
MVATGVKCKKGVLLPPCNLAPEEERTGLLCDDDDGWPLARWL